jgi:hypothetical protein
MRFKLPDGVTCASVAGQMYPADEHGIITVLPGTPADILDMIRSPNGVGATELPDLPPPAPEDIEIVVPDSQSERNKLEKKLVLDLLKVHGVPASGRATIEFLRTRLVTTLTQPPAEADKAAGEGEKAEGEVAAAA